MTVKKLAIGRSRSGISQSGLARSGTASGAAAVVIAAAVGLAGCASVTIVPAHLKPLNTDAVMLLGKKQMKAESAIFVRVFKQESELEVWKQREDGRFHHFKSYPICNWSGDLGPKIVQGDKQAPEGFYRVARHQMNPNSQFHLAFNLGYPNTYDRAHNRTGDFLMVHGKCKSAGCYAITDALIEEVYALAREAFIGGQDGFEVHAYPFRMTDANMARHKSSPHFEFWETLKPGYDAFEETRIPPSVAVCGKRYVVNVETDGRKLDPVRACPPLKRREVQRYVPPASAKLAEERVTAPGPKTRQFAENGAPPASGRMGAGLSSLIERLGIAAGTGATDTPAGQPTDTSTKRQAGAR